MIDHFDQAQRLLYNAGSQSDAGHMLTAAIAHAILAVAQAFNGPDSDSECACGGCGHKDRPVTDIEVKGNLL